MQSICHQSYSKRLGPATFLHDGVTLPLVIPTGAERSGGICSFSLGYS